MSHLNYKTCFGGFIKKFSKNILCGLTLILVFNFSNAQVVNAKLVVNGNNLSVYIIPTSTETAFVSAGSISLKGYPTGTGTIGTNTFNLAYAPGSFSSGDTSFYTNAFINQNVNFVSGTPILIFSFTAPGPGPYSIINALDYYYIEISGVERTGTATTCTVPSAPTGSLSIINSTCSNCLVSGGSIAIGTVTGSGGTLQYSTNGGTTWSSTLPIYNQTGPAQTILARVFSDALCISNTTSIGTTVPGTCPATPATSTGSLTIINSTCTNCMVSGGSISIGTVSGTGGTLQYSTDGGMTWSATLPTYNQTGPAQTILARVLANSGCASTSRTVGTTVPGTCTTPSAPTGSLNIVNSSCNASCVISGGSIAIGTVAGTGGTLQYSTNGGTTWSSTLPTYNQTGPAQSIIASVLSSNGCRSATSSVGTTVPGTCPNAPAPPTGTLVITNSICSNCSLSGGSIAIGTVSGTGGTLQYSTNGGTTWSSTLPTYNQSGPAQIILARILDASGCASSSVNVGTTVPGTCIIPIAPTGSLSITNSTCSNCLVSGGSISIGTVTGSGGTLQYSTNGGMTWSATLPTYNQTGPAQTIIASVLAANGCRSTTTSIGTTVPGTCPASPAAPTGSLTIINSTCSNCMVSGGSIAIGTVSGSGGTLQYSTDGGMTWSATLPTYNQTGPTQTILARVLAVSGCTSSSTTVGTTVPGTCVTPSAPTGSLNIVNSSCNASCVVSGGLIAIGSVTGSGGTLQYSTNGGTTWSSALPTYNQSGPTQSIIASVLASNGCRSATTSVGTTVPGTCPTAPGPPTGTLAITNSTCSNCSLSGGSITIGTVSGSGGTLQYSTNGGMTWSAILPTYNQSGPAQIVLARILDASGCASSSVNVGTTVPGTCIIPSAPTGSLSIVNSACSSGCTVSGGLISLGTVSGSGGTLQYSTDGGMTWSATLPTYNQTGPVQSILASVLAANGCRSTTTSIGTTVPGTCPASPAAPTGSLTIINSTCSNCMVSGGSISIGTVSGSGGTLQYSTDGGMTWSATLPTYNQTGPAQTILARVLAISGCTSTTTNLGTTVPGTCVTPSAPTGSLNIVNSTCNASCVVSGGSIAIGTVAGTIGTLQYSTNGGTTWSSSLPAYNQTGPAQTIIASVLATNGCRSSTTSVGTTVPGTCPTAPGPPTGTLAIANSTCSNCSLSGGSIAIGTVSGSGGTLQYSTDGGMTWSATLPIYNQTGPAQTILARVLDASGCASSSVNVGTTVPGTCIIPSAPTGTLSIVNSTCNTACTVSGGLISLGTVAGTGGTLQYSTDGGMTWSATLPTYNQSGPAQSILSSVLAANGCRSSSLLAGNTIPGVCIPLNVTISGEPIYCINKPITLTASGASTYSWSGPNLYFNNGPVASFDSASIELEGLYQVIGFETNGCTDTTTFFLDIDSCLTVNLACIDQLNVSVDENCEHCFAINDFITGKNLISSQFFTIEIFNNAGQLIISNKNGGSVCLGREWLGYKLIYKVTSKPPYNINSCWGYVILEDKRLANVGPITDTLTCFELGQLPIGPYKVPDNCSDSVLVNIVSESYTDYGCDSVYFQGVVYRQLIASDVWGNTANLNQTIYIRKICLDSVLCARDTAIDCSLEVVNGVPIKDPLRSGAPHVIINGKAVSLWPNHLSCKLEVNYRDEVFALCGKSYKILRLWYFNDWCTGRDSICRQWIVVRDTTAPFVRDTTLPVYYSSPHDCGQFVDLPVLSATDCNTTSQTYILKYYEEGKLRVLNGKLPASHIWLPTGFDSVDVTVSDVCFNTSKGKIYINIIDNTPPTPVCDEYTQVTVDPTSCWASVAANDLDNGSHDNCCNVLHFAAAPMDSIVYWRNYWNIKLEAEVGKTDFWKDKATYDLLIEEWINCYVFADTVHFGECGTNPQVVLRVYEACGVPRYDPHVWPCSPHAWFCYNTYGLYRLDFNFNWFNVAGKKSCAYRPALDSLETLGAKYNTYLGLGYIYARFAGAVYDNVCAPFYFPALSISHVNNNPPGNYCSDRLYNDCMVNVLVDDKQPPVVANLEDVIVYCDNAPDWADFPKCDRHGEPYNSSNWPGSLTYKNIEYGYYGGSDNYDVHLGAGDHNDPQACEENKGWAPIYCKSWLYLDSFDRAGHINALDYFESPVLVDKKRPLDTSNLNANQFTFTDNCALNDTTLKHVDNGTINGCGEGWIQRTWTIEDKCGNKATAVQKVIVKHRSDFEVLFPKDTTVTCDFLNRTDTSVRGAGSPKIYDDECEQIGLNYKDEIFTVEDGACYKIVRTWTLIDWCIYDPNAHDHYPDIIVDDRYRANSTNRSCVYRDLKDNNDGYMKYVQIIKVIDDIRPELTCIDQTVCIDKDCTTAVNIPLVAIDNCSGAIRFRVDITKPDGTHDKRTDITAITGSNFTAGLYSIQVIAKDQCGNEDTCGMNLTIIDCKKPTPYCLNGIATVVMPSTGSIQIWAKDFDKGSSDNCTSPDRLKFSFSKDKLDASKTLTCANILNGKEQSVQVEVWVTDEAGKQDFCTTYLLLQDNGGQAGGVCADTVALGSNATITGKLVTEEKEAVESGIVELKGSTMTSGPTWKSDVNGTYQFNSLPMNGSYTIKAIRDDQPMNGVSTLDLVLIQKHILGTESFKSPYKIIAADANNDHDVSVIDLLELRKLILGIYDKLPDNASWRFIPKSYVFNDIYNPWTYPTIETIDHMIPKSTSVVKDFIGVKIGDVNATAIPHSLMGTEVRSTEPGLIFEVEDRVFKAGDKVSVAFRSPNFKGITGFQGTIRITNDELQMTNVGPLLDSRSSLGMKANNFGTRWEHEGLITMSWNTNTSLDLKEDEVLFTMNFIAKTSGRLSEVLRIGSQKTVAESYEGKGELGNLSIRFVGKNGKEITGKSELYQNYPNPFDQRTVIGINLAESANGRLKITDITGRIIKSLDHEWKKGYQEVLIDRRDLKSFGLLFYSFESKVFNSVKRMVVID